MPHVRLLSLLLVSWIGLHASAAWGAAVTVNPVRIHLSDAQRSELIELRNSGHEAARFQAQAHAWHESADGKMTLVPTRDLLFFPSLVEIPPGETRRIRIASTARPGSVERSYRLIVEEFPRSSAPGTVQVLTRLSIPVFVQPKSPKPETSARVDLQDGQVVVLVSNTGNAYVKTQSVRVVARSASGEVVLEHTFPGWYLLAGGRRRYSVGVPGAACAEVATLDTTVNTEEGASSATASVQPGAGCGS